MPHAFGSLGCSISALPWLKVEWEDRGKGESFGTFPLELERREGEGREICDR